MVYGIWYMVHGTWYMTHDKWFLVYDKFITLSIKSNILFTRFSGVFSSSGSDTMLD